MPGIRCGSCSKFMSPSDGAKCGKCSTVYHRLCVALPQSGNIASSWRCSECRKRTTKDNTPAAANSPCTALPAISETVSDFELELRRIRDELRTVRNEFRAFREEMAEIRALNGRVETIEKRLDILEQSSSSQAISNPIVEEIVVQLKRDLNDRDQELLANDIEITNLPECNGESLTHIIKLVVTKVGVTLEDRDIISADRTGGRKIIATDSSGPIEARPRPIVVRMARRELRDTILKGARVRRGANTSDLGLSGDPKRFYINERLTKVNRVLFRQARNAAKENSWKFVWTNRGRILARRRPGDVVCRICCEADISRFFRAASEDSHQ